MLTFHRFEEPAGEPVAGAYFERYWLPIIGPTATLVMRHVACALSEESAYQIDGAELAGRMGVKPERLRGTLVRLQQMGLLRRRGDSTWDARTTVRPLQPMQVARLPEALAEQHRELTALLNA